MIVLLLLELILDLKRSSKDFKRSKGGKFVSQRSDSGNRLGRSFHRKVAFSKRGMPPASSIKGK